MKNLSKEQIEILLKQGKEILKNNNCANPYVECSECPASTFYNKTSCHREDDDYKLAFKRINAFIEKHEPKEQKPDFQVGDMVYSILWEGVRKLECNYDEEFPFRLLFNSKLAENHWEFYLDGKNYNGYIQLSHTPVTISGITTTKERYKPLEVGIRIYNESMNAIGIVASFNNSVYDINIVGSGLTPVLKDDLHSHWKIVELKDL